MQVPISVMILVIVVIGVVAAVYYNYDMKFPGNENNVLPVRASIPSGDLVYKVGNSFIIPIRFAKSTDKPIGVCKISISYTKPDGSIASNTVVLATGPSSYVTEATFDNGTVKLPVPVILQPVDTELTVTFDGNGYSINGIVFYYCEYGVSTVPKWSETLLIPETVLSP